MARPSIKEIVTLDNGVFYAWFRAPSPNAGFYYLSQEDEGQRPSISHWSASFETFELAEESAIAEKKRADQRAAKK